VAPRNFSSSKIRALTEDDVRKELFWVRFKRETGEILLRFLQDGSLPQLGNRLFEYFRISAKNPLGGPEVSHKDIILEADLERAISRTKGCYPGQEVVERIFTYGSVNRKLLGVAIEKTGKEPFSPLPWDLNQDQQRAGQLVSLAQQPDNPNHAYGLAYIQQKFWKSDKAFNGPEPNLRIVLR